MLKPSPYQDKVLARLRKGERLWAPRRYAQDGTCIGLGVYRFKDKVAVTLESVMSMRRKGLIITRDVRERGKYGFTGFSEVITQC